MPVLENDFMVRGETSWRAMGPANAAALLGPYEIDPNFAAWYAGPPNVSEFTNDAGYVTGTECLLLDQTTPQTIINGFPLYAEDHSDFTERHQLVDKEYVDSVTAQIGARFYMLDLADIGVPAYKQTSITASDLPTATVAASANAATDTLIEEWISPEGMVWAKLDPGVYTLNVWAERTAGGRTVQLFWQFYERKVDTSEVLICESNISSMITIKRLVNCYCTLSSDYIPDPGSRLVGKVYMRTGSTPANNTECTLYYQGAEDSHWQTPISQEFLNASYLRLDQATPQSFVGGAVTGTGLLKVTAGELGLDDLIDLTVPQLQDGTLTASVLWGSRQLADTAGNSVFSWSTVPTAASFVANTDGAGGGFYAGAASDVQWYHGAADTWQTPDSVVVDTRLAIGTTLGATIGLKVVNATTGASIQGGTVAGLLITSDAGTANAPEVLQIIHSTSGAAAANFGATISYRYEDDAGALRMAAGIQSRWLSAATAAYQSVLRLFGSACADTAYGFEQAGSGVAGYFNYGFAQNAAINYRGGVGVLYLASRNTAPSSNPTGGVILSTDGTDFIMRNTSGEFKYLGQDVSFRGRHSVAQTINDSAWTQLLCDTEDYDTHNGHSVAVNTSRYTCPAGQAGKYLVAGCVGGPEVAGIPFSAAIVVNAQFSTPFVYIQRTSGFLNGGEATVAGIVLLAVGDYVEIWAQQTTGVANPVILRQFAVQKIDRGG